MGNSKLVNRIVSFVLISILLGVNLFFVYRITYHKTGKEKLVETRDSVANNIKEFKNIDEQINKEINVVKDMSDTKDREDDLLKIEETIGKQKEIVIKVANLGQGNDFKKDIIDISALMKSETRMNTHIITSIIANNIAEVENAITRKQEILDSIDTVFAGLDGNIERVINPLDRMAVDEEERKNLILGQWKDSINNTTYYFNKDNTVYIIIDNINLNGTYEFVSYNEGVYKIKINNGKNNIQKDILLDYSSKEAKVKSTTNDKEILEYWSYINSTQEPK